MNSKEIYEWGLESLWASKIVHNVEWMLLNVHSYGKGP